ncbi:MAG: HugZ family protein [Alphaproteobacteria bacterium]|nr:HugZ family protein [Alphaproteobacteria bacterium]
MTKLLFIVCFAFMNTTPAKPFDPVRDANEEALRTAHHLLKDTRFASLATLDADGHPFASLVSFALDRAGAPFLFVSRLSAHTQHLLANPRAALLVGEPGKGDPLAHARMTVQCQAEPVPKDSDDVILLKTLYLARHPKAQLYADFPDFIFIRLKPLGASLNGGFGKAFRLTADEVKPK